MVHMVGRISAQICFLLALLLTIVLIRAVFADAFGFVGDSWWGGGVAKDGGTSAAFQIRGDATAPMSPGVSVPIALTFSNPHLKPMVVSYVRVSIRDLVTPHADRGHPCSLDDYRIYQMKATVPITVPAGSTAGLESLQIPRSEWPRIGMRDRAANQDGCKGARLTLGYSAFGSLDAPR